MTLVHALCMRYRLFMASIQLRNVPPELHRALKQRAKRAGMSLQEYLLAQVATIAKTPTIDEVIARIERDERFQFKESSAEALAAVRSEREEEIDHR